MPDYFPVLCDDGEIRNLPHYLIEDVMDMFHISRETVYRQMRSGEWPYMRIVKTVYFSPEHVREILRVSTHESGTPGGQVAERAAKRAAKRSKGAKRGGGAGR